MLVPGSPFPVDENSTETSDRDNLKLIVHSAIYDSDTVAIQVLTPAVLSLFSQLGLFLFIEYERTKLDKT